MSSATGGEESIPVCHRKSTIMGVTLSFQVIAFFAVIFRLYARVKLVNSPGWDDACIIVALIFMLMGSTTLSLSADYGLGRHIYTLSEHDLHEYLLFFYLMNASYVISTGFIKLSILCQYLRVFEMRRMRLICKVFLVITAIWCAVFAFMAWFPCFPIHAYWDFSIKHYQCYGYGSRSPKSYVDTYIVQGALDVFLDFVVYIIPIPVFARQKLGRRERLGFLGLFFLGLLVCVFSTVRLATIVDHRDSTNDDWSWYAPISAIMSTLEVNIAVVAASIPIFWPILEAGLTHINVTKEVHVTRQYQRHNDNDVELEQGSVRPSASQSTLNHKESNASFRDAMITTFHPMDGTKIWSGNDEGGGLRLSNSKD